MPPRKKKARSRSTARKKTARFPRVLAVALILTLVAGVVLVKYFQTPAGRSRLLDAGFHGYYAQVQNDIGEAMREVLSDHNLRGRLEERALFEKAHGETIRCLQWRITCEGPCDYILINVALTRAVREAGGAVRHSEEIDDGGTFLFTVGTNDFDTHRLRFIKAGQKAAARDEPRYPRVAIVIDDLGYSRNGVVTDLLSLDLPLTIAVLPTLPHSVFALERARSQGKCTILHLPMEPDGTRGSDLEMVTTGMDEMEIERLVRRYISSLPGIEGVNNHQGSRATADPRVMTAVLEAIRKERLFFLDSLTSNKSVAYNTARELGVATARNSLFIDADTEETEVVERRIRQLVSMARANGSAVGIGHPRRWTVDALRNSKTFLENTDIELVFLSDIVE
jgi:polysaccharide deacetylase 2 family uncharacterized protein YibQ